MSSYRTTFAGLAAVAALVACSADEPEQVAPPAGSGPEEQVIMAAPQPELTPAESIAAVTRQAERADSATRAVMGEVPNTPVYRSTIDDELALCRTQAAQAEGAIREHILGACKRLEERAAGSR